MLNGPNAFEFWDNLTMYVLQPVTDNCWSIWLLHPGALFTTVILYRDIGGFYLINTATVLMLIGFC